jgi:hypothetical protein
MTKPEPRPLDHLVLPVPALHTARDRLLALGFTVAPDGVHPFGTANCCVFFADGSFLEPLAVVDGHIAEAAGRDGNVFVRHDSEFRERGGTNGFSALVYGTADATSDHETFRRKGVTAGDVLDFGRDFISADGTQDRAEFRLAFARSTDAPDCLFFTCERVMVPDVDRSALLSHANGATGIGQVMLVSPKPSAQAMFLENVTGAAAAPARDGGLAFGSGSFELVVLTPAEFAARTSLPPELNAEPQFRAVVVGCPDIGSVEARLRETEVAFHHAPAGLVVPPGPGQGAAFIFVSQ